ncbi:MAG: VOC family protein [Actinomycetota bacterium]|nr:VOC family protein [Actinomycetota bacterium]
MPNDYPPVCPYLFYEDGFAALRFLVEAFGFRVRHEPDSATFGHAEVEIGDGGVVMLGTPGRVEARGTWGGVHVYVADVDEHCRRARAAGATIVSEPTDMPYGDRSYETRDTEGNTWWFAQQLHRPKESA